MLLTRPSVTSRLGRRGFSSSFRTADRRPIHVP